MTIAAALEIALAVLVLGMAAWTIAARETFAAVVGFVAYGLLLALVWVRLDAVDVALTEAAIGGLTGVLLLGAAARLRASETPAVAERRTGSCVSAPRCSRVVAAALAAGVLALPDPAPTLAPAAAANIAATGLGNPVTGVLMAFRAMDTLLEKVVLLLALVGVWSLAPDRFWGGRPGPRHQADPHGVLAFLARLLPPVGIVVGIYIFWVGADHPGGAFQGGAILAAMWLLVMMAGLTDAPPVSRRWLRLVLVAGPAVFLAVGLGGTLAGRRLPRLSRGLRQAADPGDRGRDDAVDRGDARPAARRSAGTERLTMSAATVFGLCAAVAVGLGLYGLIVNPQPLRKILAFNLLGSGVFLFFGVVARRGAAAGFGGDPVPQALVITGIVVAFSATALAVALLLRLFQATGSATLRADAPASAGTDPTDP